MSSLPALITEFARDADALAFWLPATLLGLAAAGCAYLGINALYRSRLIADMPTSKLRSAAQGYVELEGRARAMPGEPVYAPLSGKPCVWYRYSVEQTGRDAYGGRSDGWSTIEAGVSEAIFQLEDGTGVCVVDPDGAEVMPSVKLCWRGDSPRPLHTPSHTGFWAKLFSFGSYRYTEWRLHDQDSLYAIGQFISAGAGESHGIDAATRDLLAIWKRDRGWLLQRFDADRDGKIDMEEWENARQAAEREVIASWRERQHEAETNILKKPPHGRPYILASATQDRLAADYRRKALSGTLGFFALGALLAWAVRQRLG